MKLQELARKAGSSATTDRGSLRAIKKFIKAREDRSLEAATTKLDPTLGEIEAAKKTGRRSARHILFGVDQHRMTPQDYKRDLAMRRSGADVKRAKGNKKYRAKLLSSLAAKSARLNRPPTNLRDLLCRAKDYSRGYTWRQIQAKRSAITGREYSFSPTPFGDFDNVGLLDISLKQCKKLGINWSKRGKDFQILSSADSSHQDYSAGETEWKNGRPVRYNRTVNDWVIRSVAFIRSSNIIEYAVHNCTGSITLPDGYTWAKDENGLFAADVRGNDYHPTADDLLSDNPVDLIVGKITENARIREENKARIAVDLANAEGVFVCMDDSIRAGNCEVGTINWAKSHDLDVSKHYPADMILNEGIKNGSLGRVRLAVASASRRHRREMKQGFCELADKKI